MKNPRMNRRQLLASAALLAAVPRLALAARQPALHIVTSELPPLVMEDGGGALRELVAELCRRAQLTPELEFVPWRRAILLATTLPSTAIFPLTRQPEREDKFRWLAPLYEERYCFVAPRDGRFDLQHPERMKARRIALLRGAAQAAMLKDMGYHRLVEAASVDEVHRFLTGGMADAVFGEAAIIRASLKVRAGESEFAVSAPLRTATAWLAGTLDFSDAEVERFRQAMDGMLADGTARRILSRHGL
jgi:ABC-type amino acid transport substrate-binding protein